MYSTNRLSSINPDKADIVRESNETLSSKRESIKAFDKIIESVKDNDDVTDAYANLNEAILLGYNLDVMTDIYIDSLKDKFVNESVYTEAIKSDIVTRANNAKQTINAALSRTVSSIQSTIADMITRFEVIEKADKEKHAKLFNIANNFAFATEGDVIVLKYRPEFDNFPGICNFRFYGPGTRASFAALATIENIDNILTMTDEEREAWVEVNTKAIDDVANKALDTYELWKLTKDDSVIYGYSEMLKSNDGVSIKTAIDRLSKLKDDAFSIMDAAVEADNNESYTTIARVRETFEEICKVYLYSINKYRLVHTELFSANRAAFLCLTRYLAMKDEYDINESNTIFLNSGAYIRQGIKFADTVANEYELLCNNHYNAYTKYCKAVGLSEVKKLMETGDIVYEAADIDALKAKVKTSLNTISKSIDRFYDKQATKFKKLQDKKVSLSKEVIDKLSDDFVATTHQFFDVKALSYTDRAIKAVKEISDIYKKFAKDKDLSGEVDKVVGSMYSTISGIKDVSGMADMKKYTRNNLTGNAVTVDKQWIIENSKTITKIVENDAYTDTVIKSIKDADTKLFDAVYKEIDSIDNESYTTVLNSWLGSLIKVVNATHMCYCIALDVYRREFVEYRNVVVKAIKANK